MTFKIIYVEPWPIGLKCQAKALLARQVAYCFGGTSRRYLSIVQAPPARE